MKSYCTSSRGIISILIHEAPGLNLNDPNRVSLFELSSFWKGAWSGDEIGRGRGLTQRFLWCRMNEKNKTHARVLVFEKIKNGCARNLNA